MPTFLSRVFNIPLSFILKIRNLLWGIRSTKLYLSPALVKDYCDEAIDEYYALFDWAPMNPTLHLLLAHLPDFLQSVPKGMKLGYFSEEPLESCHKKIRQFAKTRASPKTRKLRLTNVFQRQLDISNIKVLKRLAKYYKKPRTMYPKDLTNLQMPFHDDEMMDISQ